MIRETTESFYNAKKNFYGVSNRNSRLPSRSSAG